MSLHAEDRKSLQKAVYTLENPTLVTKLTSLIGQPIEKGMELLPAKATDIVNTAARKAIKSALEAATFTMKPQDNKVSYEKWHKLLVTASGATGGAFGLISLPIELPISTTIMLRSILDIARHEGEDIEDLESKLECIAVFALGGHSKDDDAAETGYYAVRSALAKSVTEAAKYITEKGLAEEGAPVLMRFITKVAEKFGFVITQQAAAKAVPVVGAVAGGAINYIFIDHFQDMARGHFTVRRLEKKYGHELIRKEYEECREKYS